MKGRIHSLESFGTLDGPGVRFVVFLQGCPLRCGFCHNPDSWAPEGGSVMSCDELLGRINSCRSFIRNGGVTLSGGEPLLQPEFSLELLRRCRESGFHTALDTAGSLPPEISVPVAAAADLVLLDIKSIDGEACRRLTGQDNRHALALLDECEKIGKPVWIRQVQVPGRTLEEGQLKALAEYLAPFRCIERVELLPYHKMAAFKWERLGCADPLAGTPAADPDEFRRAQEFFARCFRSAGKA